MLLIEYIIETFGEPALRQVLSDLRRNAIAEKSLGRRLASLEEIESGFTMFAVDRAWGQAKVQKP